MIDEQFQFDGQDLRPLFPRLQKAHEISLQCNLYHTAFLLCTDKGEQ